MLKIMLVLDNETDQEFLEKVLRLLSFEVISLSKGLNISDELIDHFPDIVFASTLGRNEKILSALITIKQARGKPKLVFVRQEREAAPLNAEQKKVIDGVLYTPIDPFKLIEILAETTSEDIHDLKKKYFDMMKADKGAKGIQNKLTSHDKLTNQFVTDLGNKDQDYGDTHVMGLKSQKSGQTYLDEPSQTNNTNSSNTKTTSNINDNDSVITKNELRTENENSVTKDSNFEQSKKIGGEPLITDPLRNKKYNDICSTFEKVDKFKRNVDIKKLKELQSMQSKKIVENKQIKEDRKHFIKTLFCLKPFNVKKD
jgi:AmiR/NasT family two-component response regulator